MLFPDLHRKPPGFTPPHPRAVALITWYTTPDLSAVRVINASVRDPWTTSDLPCLLNDNRASTMVARRGNVVAAFASYHLREKVLELTHFAVHPEHRHIGVGSQLFDTLDRKLSMHHLPRLIASISELDEPVWAWFLGRGMRGCGVARDGIRPEVDAYLFEYWGRDDMTGVGNCPTGLNDVP